MIVTPRKYVVSRTSAGGMSVRELAADGGRLLGYTVPGRDFWVACIRPAENADTGPWATSQQRTPEDAEAVLRAELGMPNRPGACPGCADDPEEGPFPCWGKCPPSVTVVHSSVGDFWPELQPAYVGGLR
jgi:hypothetical protein